MEPTSSSMTLKHSPQPLPQPPPVPSLVPTSDSMTYNTVATGIRCFFRNGRVLVWGSLGFAWLLSMRTCNWSHVTVCGSIPDPFRAPIELEWGSRLHICEEDSCVDPNSYDLGLIGSSPSTFGATLSTQRFNGPRLVWLHPAPRRITNILTSLGPRTDISSYRLTHAESGGVTQAIGTFLTLGIPPLTFDDVVGRTLQSIIDYKLYLPPGSSSDATLSISHRLPPKSPYALIAIPSRFASTGFGIRSLSFAELCLAWDLPLWCTPQRVSKRFCSAVLQLTPLKLLTHVLDASLVALPALPGAPIGLASLGPLPIPLDDPRGTWLPDLNTWLSPGWIDDSLVTEKAVKVDASGVPTHLWDLRISLVLNCPTRWLGVLRTFMHRVVCRRVRQSFCAYMFATHGTLWVDWILHRVVQGGTVFVKTPDNTVFRELVPTTEFLRDLTCGRNAVAQFCDSSWWKWDRGSSLLFWRWPQDSIKSARDGFPIWVLGKLPTYKRKQRSLLPEVASLVANKIGDVRWKKYISPIDFTISDVDYFSVPKGIDPDTGAILDIRMVYNGTSSGLNASVWAPSFWMPTPATAIRQVHYGYFSIDLDLGEFFLNFPLSESIRPYAGVRMESIQDLLDADESQDPVSKYEAWSRLLMGFTPSPFCAVRHFYFAEEFVFGDVSARSNPMRWDKVVFNLPGMASFDPRMPWVYLWDESDQCIAGTVITFVDDGRGSGRNAEHAWLVGRRYATMLQYLGIQHATRKIRPPSQEPGAWAGMMLKTNGGRVSISATQAKWNKVKSILARIETEWKELGDLEFKQLESERGFLVHLAMTYRCINPFLKGFHLTLDSWRPNRKDNGWKMTPAEWSLYLNSITDPKERELLAELGNLGHPSRVKSVSRFESDLTALKLFFSKDTPTEIAIRGDTFHKISYAFGDASGSGFGDSFLSEDGLSYQQGVWIEQDARESSNYRELKNCLEAVRREGEAGRLKNSFLLFCTDNSTVETALFKGTSSSPKLLDCVIEFYNLQMEFGFLALVSHVSGKRMIQQGADGLSRGALNEGVMKGDDLMDYLPFHLSAIERSPKILEWIRSWGGDDAILLQPADWFIRGHDITGGSKGEDGFWRPTVEVGTYVWTPPPAAADVALEQLRKARIKRHNSTHIFIVPRLMTPLWMRQLYKAADIVLTMPPGTSCWGENMLEPCLIGICFPFIKHRPWQLKSTPKLRSVQREVHKVWKDQCMDPGHILRELRLVCKRFSKMPKELVWKMLYFES